MRAPIETATCLIFGKEAQIGALYCPSCLTRISGKPDRKE